MTEQLKALKDLARVTILNYDHASMLKITFQCFCSLLTVYLPMRGLFYLFGYKHHASTQLSPTDRTIRFHKEKRLPRDFLLFFKYAPEGLD